jgi:hypothetical protein
MADMNKYQRIAVIVMAVNILLMFLFPPFLDNPIRRGTLPSFDSFYPLMAAYGVRRIHSELLTLQVMFVVINGLVAWLLLDRGTVKGDIPEFRYTRAIGLFVAANLAVVLIFPPFESYSSLTKYQASTFDSFYFLLGDKRNRNIFIPILYLEVTLVVINAMIVWLLFNTVRREELAAKEKILELARALPAEDLAEISTALRSEYKPAEAPPQPHYGARPDRRKRQDPRYRGPERRSHGDRRNKERAA